MYTLLNIDALIESAPYWAHTREGKESEPLKAHLLTSMKYYNIFCTHKGLEQQVYHVIQECSSHLESDKVQAIYDMFVNAVFLHDVGKINPQYQRDTLGNGYFPKCYGVDSHHSPASAFIYIDLFYERAVQDDLLLYFLFSFAYAISRHHGRLNNMKDFVRKMNDIYPISYYSSEAEWLEDMELLEYSPEDIRNDLNIREIPFYILNKLLFAVITACDYCATTEYCSDSEMDISIVDDITELRHIYENGRIYRGIQASRNNAEYFKDCAINALRSEMFLEADTVLQENPGNCIYYLEAPTGSGKTNMSINLALRMLDLNNELNNIFYIFPFNTLIEQTSKIICEYFPKETAVVNSITPIVIKEEENAVYEAALLDRQFLGRINRSCMKQGAVAFFFNYDNPEKIYRNDARTNHSILDKNILEMLEQKRFADIYELVLKDVFNKTEMFNHNHIKNLLKAALTLDFTKVEKQLRLIEKNVQLYVAHTIDTGKKVVDGREVWRQFKELCSNKEKSYAQVKVELSQLAEEMSYFTYNLYNMDDKSIICDETFGSYYYIEDGERFITDGKFDRKAFSAESGGLFL